MSTELFDVEIARADHELIRKIVARIRRLAPPELSIDALSLSMDLTACHVTTPLDLAQLLAFTDGTFGHDVFGIQRHLNRKTGLLGDCFLPRCAL